MIHRAAHFLHHPAALFTVLSLAIGVATIAVTPPLRGPDENAHFLRAYGLWRGDLVPRQTDDKGRRGLFLPARLKVDFAFFDSARERAGSEGFSYREVFARHAAQPPRRDLRAGEDAAVFATYGGSEAYSPIAYLPYVLAAAPADLLGLDFLPMLYLMRFAGLAATTVIIAYAIAQTPVLPWGFLAVAMLPSALFGRAVVSADGAALGTTLVVIALTLRAAANGGAGTAERAVWTSLCALTKPSQVAFVALEAMARPRRLPARRWTSVAAITIPAVVLSILWVLATGAEMAAWRLYGEAASAEQLQPAWKLRFMLTHPLHFPAIALTSFDYADELWRQLVGVLGWLDIRLQPPFYLVLTGLLIAANLDRLDLPVASRVRIAWVAIATALAYAIGVFVLFFLTSTPIDAERVHGVQGRYFLAVVPLLALFAAAFTPRRPSVLLPAAAAMVLSLLSGFAIMEAVMRVDWR